ncbi:hypothetical protein ACHQM5_013381 [Ranunculus cassubicifolius]
MTFGEVSSFIQEATITLVNTQRHAFHTSRKALLTKLVAKNLMTQHLPRWTKPSLQGQQVYLIAIAHTTLGLNNGDMIQKDEDVETLKDISHAFLLLLRNAI